MGESRICLFGVRDISLGLPDRNTRKLILEKLSKNYALVGDDFKIDLDTLAKLTPGIYNSLGSTNVRTCSQILQLSGFVASDLKELFENLMRSAKKRLLSWAKSKVSSDNTGSLASRFNVKAVTR